MGLGLICRCSSCVYLFILSVHSPTHQAYASTCMYEEQFKASDQNITCNSFCALAVSLRDSDEFDFDRSDCSGKSFIGGGVSLSTKDSYSANIRHSKLRHRPAA